MESTGVYGGPLREKLEISGISVTVINPGMYRKPDKTDDSHDSSWIHLYHSVDLFKKSHFAPEQWRDLREYIHERDITVTQKAATLTRMERLLSMMNIQLPHTVSDIEGAGAMAIINAIAKGETDPEKLADLLNVNLFKASGEELVESLRGNYRSCSVNMLKEKVSEYNFFVSQMHEYEQYIISILEELSVLEEQKRMINRTIDQNQDQDQNQNTEVKKRLFKRKRKKRKHVKMNISLMDSLIFAVFWE